MPILWKHLLKNYFKIFLLGLFLFLGIGLILRHKHLTMFFAAGGTFSQTVIVALCFLLEAFTSMLGIFCLITAFLTTRSLSYFHEISLFRASGISISQILTPIYLLAITFALLKLLFVSELIPHSRLLVNKMYLQSNSVNPLVLIRKNALPIVEKAYVEMDLSSSGKYTKNPIIITKNERTGRLSLFTADEISIEHNTTADALNAFGVSYFPSGKKMEHLLMENQETFSSPIETFITMLRKKINENRRDMYRLKQVFPITTKETLSWFLILITNIGLPFSLTIFGASLGLYAGKAPKNRQLIIIGGASFITFLLSIAEKKAHILPPLLALLILITAHILPLSYSFFYQKEITKGIE